MAELNCVIHVQELGESPAYGMVYTVWTECKVSTMYHCSAALSADQVTGLIDTLTARAAKWSRPYVTCRDGAVLPGKRNSDGTPNFDALTVSIVRHDRND